MVFYNLHPQAIAIILYGFQFWTLIAVFGMNVGGVPWTGQNSPELKDGFRNVILVCIAMLLLVLLCFLFPALYTRIAAAWRNKRALGRNWSLNKKSLFRRPLRIEDPQRGGYLRIWWCESVHFILWAMLYSLPFVFKNVSLMSISIGWFSVAPTKEANKLTYSSVKESPEAHMESSMKHIFSGWVKWRLWSRQAHCLFFHFFTLLGGGGWWAHHFLFGN